MRLPSHPDFDRTTLYIPPDEVRKLNPVMQQYWHFKCMHYDKIVFFKIGRFYEIFYDDAILCHKYLDLSWMGDKSRKLQLGFPDVSLGNNAKTLVDLGFKVVVVNQIDIEEPEEADDTESPKDTPESKAKAKKDKKKNKKKERVFMD